MNPQKYLDRLIPLIERDLMPDVCRIETVTGSARDANGAVVQTWSPRLYEGNPYIPCRLDNSRSFRPEKLPFQEINANEYILQFPVSVPLKTNDMVYVTVDNVEHRFEVRKTSRLAQWRTVNTALIVELEGQYD